MGSEHVLTVLDIAKAMLQKIEPEKKAHETEVGQGEALIVDHKWCSEKSRMETASVIASRLE